MRTPASLFADYLMIYRLIRLTPTNKLTHAVDRCHHKVNDDIVYSAKMVILVIFLFKSYYRYISINLD